MARLRILQAVAGLDFSWSPGDEVDLPGPDAARWADGVRAELVRGEQPEHAVAPNTETTRRARPPRGRT